MSNIIDESILNHINSCKEAYIDSGSDKLSEFIWCKNCNSIIIRFD